ncbi:MAG: AI-2E family transporter, partial [Chloroflexi bacterium]|nr:AI-2E family transporter [Chloroflexota bacterium]
RPLTLFGFPIDPPTIVESRNLDQALTELIGQIAGGTFDVFSSVGTNLLWTIVGLCALYLFLAEGPRIREWVVNAVAPPFQEEWSRLLEDIDRVWVTFFWGQLLIFAIMFIPTVGSVYGVIYLNQIGLVRLSPIGLIIAVIVVYTLVQQIDNFLLRPYILGESLRIHPALVIIGLIAGGVVGGAVGVIIAVPLIASTRVVGIYVHRKLMGLPAFPDEEVEDTIGNPFIDAPEASHAPVDTDPLEDAPIAPVKAGFGGADEPSASA